MTRTASGIGLATFAGSQLLDAWFPAPVLGPDAPLPDGLAESEDPARGTASRIVTVTADLDAPPADAADAIALAITHAWRGGLMGRGLETASLTSPARPSRFPTTPGASRGQGGGMTAAQKAWLAAEKKAAGGRRPGGRGGA